MRLESSAGDAGVGECFGDDDCEGVVVVGAVVVLVVVVLDWCEWSLSWIHLMHARLRTFSAVRGQGERKPGIEGGCPREASV